MSEQIPTMDLGQFLKSYFAVDVFGFNSDGTITLKWNICDGIHEEVVTITLSPESRGHNTDQLETVDQLIFSLRQEWDKDL